jgi:hypothetical protein
VDDEEEIQTCVKANAVYTALIGIPPQTDGDAYDGFEAEGQQIGLVPGGGPQGMTRGGGMG